MTTQMLVLKKKVQNDLLTRRCLSAEIHQDAAHIGLLRAKRARLSDDVRYLRSAIKLARAANGLRLLAANHADSLVVA